MPEQGGGGPGGRLGGTGDCQVIGGVPGSLRKRPPNMHVPQRPVSQQRNQAGEGAHFRVAVGLDGGAGAGCSGGRCG
jgi:hypothetical protein